MLKELVRYRLGVPSWPAHAPLFRQQTALCKRIIALTREKRKLQKTIEPRQNGTVCTLTVAVVFEMIQMSKPCGMRDARPGVRMYS